VRITQRPLFYWILRRHRPLQVLLLLVILASLFFRVFPLEMQKRIINEAIHLKDEQLLFIYCGLYMGAVVLAAVSKYAINVMQTVIGQKILVEMRSELYRHLLQLPLQFYRKVPPGTVISAMTAELNGIGFFLGGALAIPVTSVLTFLVFLGFMFSLSPLLALLSVVIYPLEMIVIPLLQKRYNRLNKKRIKTTRAMSNVVNEGVSGIQEIHANASYQLEEKRMAAFIETLYNILKRLFIVKYGIKFANNMFQSFGPFILFLVGGYLTINGQFTLGALVAFLSAYEKVYDPWKEMMEYYQALQNAQVLYRQVMSTFDRQPRHPLLPDGREPYRLRGSIELKEVSCTVDGGIKVLDRITMQIRPNEQVALVGFSGAGKTTLVLLIAQLYDADQGSLLLDGKEAGTLSKADISRNISMIAQQPFIFTGSLRDNLLYAVRADRSADGRELPGREQLFQVSRDVGLEEDLLRFGFNSIIPRERVLPLKQNFLHMRRIIRKELGEHFVGVVEFYDADTFLSYSSLRDNIIFGESPGGEYDIDELPDNPVFRDFLGRSGLEPELLRLGRALAEATVELLKKIGDDEFFFRGSPMEADEFDRYKKLVDDLDGRQPQKKEEKDALLLLALRFIPGHHTIVTMPPGLAEKILQARHRFLEQIAGIDLKTYRRAEERPRGRTGATALPQRAGDSGAGGDFIAYCPSEYLYKHSLRDNILFGATTREARDVEGLYEVTKQAFAREGLLDEILDIGLDFEVGSKGDRLSGGQKQKVAIARALLKDAPILIMDEATSSLDNTSQARIQKLLETRYRGNKTIIAVIHRLDLAPSYDRIFVLKAGSLVEQGTYDELMAQKGAFYELARKH